MIKLLNPNSIDHDLKRAADVSNCARWLLHKFCIDVAAQHARLVDEISCSWNEILVSINRHLAMAEIFLAYIFRAWHWIKRAEKAIKLSRSSCDIRRSDNLTTRFAIFDVLQFLMKRGLHAPHVRTTTTLSNLGISWRWKCTNTGLFHSKWIADFSTCWRTMCFVNSTPSAALLRLWRRILIREIRLLVVEAL